MLMAAASDPGTTAYTLTAILASSVIVLGGLAALVRVIWKTANLMRDSANAVKSLTEHVDKLTLRVNELERKTK